MANSNLSSDYKKHLLSKIERWVPPSSQSNLIRLDLNENYIDDGDLQITEGLKNFEPSIISRYPDYTNLLTLLETYVGISKKSILLTNGADQGIDLICRLLFLPKSKVLIPSPIFSYYYHVLKTLDIRIVPVMHHLSEGKFTFPHKMTLKQLDKSQGVILCNPNNPLGIPIPMDSIIEIVDKSYALNIPCIIDEAYFEFYGETSLSLIRKYPNVIIIRTFSKFFSLSGLRLGYVVAHDSIVDHLLKLRGPWDINHFAVFAGEFCLSNRSLFQKKNKELNANKRQIYSILDSAGILYQPSVTNFITVQNKESDLLQHIKNKGFLGYDLSVYPYSLGSLKGYARFSIPQKKNFLKFIDALKKLR